MTGLTVLVGVLAAATWGSWGDLDYDTGYDLQAANRLLDGEVPYRDFLYYYGPLGPGVIAALAAAFGTTTSAAIALGFAIALVIIATTYAIARRLASPLGGLLAASITAAVAFIPDNFNFILPHATNATLGTLLLLGTLLAVERYAASGRGVYAASVGALLGLLALTKPEPALAGALGVAAWLVARRRTEISRPRELVAVLAPALAVPAVVYGTFLLAVSPHRLLLENLYPKAFLDENPLVRGRIPLTVESFVDLAARVVVYALAVAWMVAVAALFVRGGRSRAAGIVLATTSIGLALTALVARPDGVRHLLEFAYGWVPAGAAVAAAAAVYFLAIRRTGDPSPDRQLELVGLVALAVLAATSYAAFFPHAPFEQIAVYAIPLAAIFMTRLHLEILPTSTPGRATGAAWLAFLALAGLTLAIKDARLETVRVTGVGGTIGESANEGALYQDAVDWIGRETRPGDPIFVAPLMSGLYVLSDRRNPTEHLSVLPGSLHDATAERRVISTLRDENVPIVVTDDRVWHVFGEGRFGESFNRTLAQWIAANYEQIATLRSEGWRSFEGDVAPRQLFIWRKRA